MAIDREIREALVNCVTPAVPGVFILLCGVVIRLIHRERWKPEFQDKLMPTFGELGPITRIHRETWSVWKFVVANCLGIVSIMVFTSVMLLMHLRPEGVSDPVTYRWRAFHTLLQSLSSLCVIGFYKSRGISPRKSPGRVTSRFCVEIYWLMVIASCVIQLWDVIMFLNPWPGSAWDVVWNLIWIATPSILLAIAVAGLVLFGFKKELRDDIPRELQQTFLPEEPSAGVPTSPMGDGLTRRLQSHIIMEKRHPSPEIGSNIISAIGFGWIDRLIRLGNKRLFEYADFYNTPADLQPAVLYVRFKKLWEEQLAIANGKPGRWALAKAVYFFTLPYTNFSALVKFAYDTQTMFGPLYLNLTVNYLSEKNRGAPSATILLGLLYVALLFVNNMTKTILLHQYFHWQYNLGLQIRSALNTLIYQKSLDLDRGASDADPNSDFSSGRVVNLMAVDSQRVADLMAYIHIIWSSPYQIIVSIVLLWFQLRYAALAGMAVMVGGIPLTKWMVGKMRKRQVVLLGQKDVRIKKTQETLMGMRAVKFYAWEEARMREITDIRGDELQHLWKVQLMNVWNRALMFGIPVLVALVSFAVYTLGMGEELTPAVAFTSLALFDNLQFPMIVLPNIVVSLSESIVTLDRTQKFLLLPNLKKRQPIPLVKEEPAVIVSNMSLQHAGRQPLLTDFNASMRMRQLTAVVGRTGCGKSAFLAAMLGEFEPTKGGSELRGRVAFCSQSAWIQTGTVKDNILFFEPYDEAKYHRTLEACALVDDLQVLADGDETEIGERGINLSGGQKQRIALARAVYKDADVYLLDDVLSAVDAHVAEHIFHSVFKGVLQDKCIVLVTHRFDVLKECDQIFYLHDATGAKFDDVQAAMQDPGFSALAAETLKRIEEEDKEKAKQEELTQKRRASKLPIEDYSTPPHVRSPSKVSSVSVQRTGSKHLVSGSSSRRSFAGEAGLVGDLPPSTTLKEEALEEALEELPIPLDKSQSYLSTGSRIPSIISVTAKKDRFALVEEEKMEEGKVSWAVYKAYFKATGNNKPYLPILVMAILLLSAGAQVGSSFWLSNWSARASPSSPDYIPPATGVGGYVGLNMGYVLLIALSTLVIAIGAQRASRIFHKNLLERILGATVSFFEATPTGRLISRFTKDVQSVDDLIPSTLAQYAQLVIRMISVIVAIAIVLPWMILVLVPLIGVYLWVERIYVTVVRQFRRIESVLRAPVISNFSETFEGAPVIRAFQEEKHFRLLHMDHLNANLSAIYIANAANRWLAVRNETLGTVLISCVALIAVCTGGGVSAALGGLALSYAIACVNQLNWLVRMSGDREANVVAVERLDQYNRDDRCPQERYESHWIDKKLTVPGQVVFDGVSLQYRPGLPFALKDCSFVVEPGEKVGVVGRTGAGKSSLLLVLLRLYQIQDGRILLHGVPIEPMSVTEIRRAIAIIPQEPTLFTGSLRINLDPFNEYTDEQLWEAVNNASLGDFVRELEEGFDTQITEGGANLSAGQKQLVCLTRVLLKGTRVLLLDEATSAVDPQTDAIIQRTIREKFSHCTILTIAHRIQTIMDYDKIIVMSDGHVAEYAPPQELLKNPDSLFTSLVRAAEAE